MKKRKKKPFLLRSKIRDLLSQARKSGVSKTQLRDELNYYSRKMEK